ncbi:MAG: DUF1330 domain-containing protein [Desulfuromonas sp.]|nr:MAG: DUF1330 domain-containing protein [Desulfuromonas sp.]
MAAYLIGQINIMDEELWQQYVDGVRLSLVPYSAEIVFRGRQAAVLAGENDRDLVVVIAFPDRDVVEKWFASAQYQSLIPLRDQAADVVITIYDTY